MDGILRNQLQMQCAIEIDAIAIQPSMAVVIVKFITQVSNFVFKLRIVVFQRIFRIRTPAPRYLL